MLILRLQKNLLLSLYLQITLCNLLPQSKKR